jgi:hypothetical protein
MLAAPGWLESSWVQSSARLCLPLPSDLYLQTLSVSQCFPTPFFQLIYQTGSSLGIHLSEFWKPLRHCSKGMAPLMPGHADGKVDRKQEKPEKILFLHPVVLEALTLYYCIA